MIRKGIPDPRGWAAVVFSSLNADSGTELGTSLPSLLHELGGRGAGEIPKLFGEFLCRHRKVVPICRVLWTVQNSISYNKAREPLTKLFDVK